MIRSKLWILVLVCLVLVLVPSAVFARRRLARRSKLATPVIATSPASAPKVTTTPLPTPSTFKIDPAQAMADILRIRSADAVDTDAASDAAFEAALRETITQEHGEFSTPATAPSPAAAPAIATSAAPVEALRRSAKHFDDRASELEAARDYTAADSARETAAELRREARRLDP